MGILDRILRAGEGKKLKALQGIVPEINALEDEMRRLTDEALKAKTGEFRQRLDNGADVDDLLVEAFAVTREAADRVIGQRHFDVQMMGGAALHFGWVAEMKTGEGKTLTSTLPGVSERGRRQGCPPRHGQRLPRDGSNPSGWVVSIAGWASTSVSSFPDTSHRRPEKRMSYAR